MVSLKKGLVGHWTLDSSDTSNGTLYDSSAYDYHGIIKNGPIPTTDSVLGDAYSFDGISSNRYVDVPDSVQSKIDGNEEASIAVWMKLPYNSADNGDNTGPFSFQGSGASDTHWVWTNGDGYFPTFRTSRVDNVPTDSIDLTNWHHLAITTEPGADGWKLYINGEEHYSVDGQATVSADDQALIGWNDSTHYFKGNMSDFRLYDRALSKMEISALYNMRSQRQHNVNELMNTKVNGKDVVLQRDSYGSWICVQNYEHYGGTNPAVSPGSKFPQLPNGKNKISDIESSSSNGELRHVDNITQYGDWQVDAVRLHGETSNHSRKINYYSENQSVIDAVVNNTASVGHSALKDSITKYPDHTSFLPDNMAADNNNQTDNNSDRIFGHGFPMYGDGSDGTRVHWSVAGFGNRWEVDDYPADSSKTTIHRVWVRTGLFD